MVAERKGGGGRKKQSWTINHGSRIPERDAKGSPKERLNRRLIDSRKHARESK